MRKKVAVNEQYYNGIYPELAAELNKSIPEVAPAPHATTPTVQGSVKNPTNRSRFISNFSFPFEGKSDSALENISFNR